MYSWGVGVGSAIYAENNVFLFFQSGVTPERIIRAFSGKAIEAKGTLVDDGTRRSVDVLAAYNAASEPKLASDVGWKPALVGRIDPTDGLAAAVQRDAGPK
jgi:pectate lyase